jgi:hypothetical protein
MKNLHLIPTDKPSRLHLGNSGLVLCESVLSKYTINGQHIYITSDEEIKEGDWWLNRDDNKIYHNVFWQLANNAPSCKKIILTTDQDLIKDGVQPIDDEFLEWFVKNPSCEKVEVEKDEFYSHKAFIKGKNAITYDYKIIIPKEEAKQRAKNYMSLKGALEPNQIKCYCGHTSYCDCSPLEEPKQEENEIIDISDHDGIGNAVDNLNNEPPQETLEEASERLYPIILEDDGWDKNEQYRDEWIEGAKWRQEQDKNKYSEEEVLEFANWCRIEDNKHPNRVITIQQLFEQFKNK